MKIKIKDINYNNFITFLTLFAFIFLWDLNKYFFYIIILPVILIFFNKENYKIKKKNFFLLLIIYLIIIYLTVSPYELININLKIISDLIGLFLVTIFCIYFRQEIILNIKNVVLIFSIVYFVLNFSDFIINYNRYNISDFNLINFKRCHYFTGLFRLNILFSENSHFGMVSVAVSYYLLYLISIEKKIFFKIIFLLIVMSFFYNSSTTSILGYTLSFFAVHICCYKKINNQFLLLTTAFLIITIFIFFTSSSCMKRFQDVGRVAQTYKEIQNLNVKKNKNLIKNTINEKKNKKVILEYQNDLNKKFNEYYAEYYASYNKLFLLMENFEKNEIRIKNVRKRLIYLEKKLNEFDKDKFKIVHSNLSTNLTTQVYLRSFYILLEAIKEKPLGWGLNNYYLASTEYRYKVPFINPATVFLNSHDASNNFVKLITEFGVFGLFLLVIITLICLNQKIDYRVKIFFMPLIITQLIRGAGYFSGGFIFALNILIILYIFKSINSLNENTRD